MQAVLSLIERDHLAEALIQLWNLAERRTLDEWERQWDRNSEAKVREMVELLSEGRVPALSEVLSSPLVLVRALDEFLGDLAPARRPSPRPYAISGSEFWLVAVALAGRRRTSRAKQWGTRLAWFRRHSIFPARTHSGIGVRVVFPGPELRQRMQQLCRARPVEVRCWVGHFNDGCAVIGGASPTSKGRWRAEGISSPERRRHSLRSSLERASMAGAHFVVFPELSVEPGMRSEVGRAAGKFLLVVPGSFHEAVGNHVYNSAPLCDGCTGATLFTHRKLRVYGRLPEEGAEVVQTEAIEVGNDFHVLVTPLGEVAVLICKDFLDADASVATLLQEVSVDWVMVPSCGSKKTVEAHRRRAIDLAARVLGCSVLVANMQISGESDSTDTAPGFVVYGNCSRPIEVGVEGEMIVCPVLMQGSRPGV